ncbi:MAG: SMC-Scp complex subunit ScpB, partial [Panacibacter sp.]
GRSENMPGKPLIYATSKNFMDYFGINSAADLPKIREVLAEQMVEPTIIGPGHFATPMQEEVEDALLVVDSNGDLIIHPDSITEIPEDSGAPGETNNEETNNENETPQE